MGARHATHEHARDHPTDPASPEPSRVPAGPPEVAAHTWHSPDARLRAQPARLAVPDDDDTSSPQGQGEREHRLRARSS